MIVIRFYKYSRALYIVINECVCLSPLNVKRFGKIIINTNHTQLTHFPTLSRFFKQLRKLDFLSLSLSLSLSQTRNPKPSTFFNGNHNKWFWYATRHKVQLLNQTKNHDYSS